MIIDIIINSTIIDILVNSNIDSDIYEYDSGNNSDSSNIDGVELAG